MTKLKDIICPTCSKKNTWTPNNPSKPFCSERCKLIDLGAWAAEDHTIPGDETINLPTDDNEEEK